MWISYVLPAKLESEIGSNAAGNREKSYSRKIDNRISCLRRSRDVTVKKLGHFDGYDPVFEAE